MSVSKKIIKRIKDANARFHADDNISEFINESEYDLLVDEVTKNFHRVLESLVIDTENDPNSIDTARRWAKMYIHEVMHGRYYPRPEVSSFPNEGDDCYKGMLVQRCELKSLCSHHHQAVTGTCYIGIIPNAKVIGLSKYIRLAQWAARRGTLQENLCMIISKEIKKATKCDDIAVYIQAVHGCISNRGVCAHSSLAQTTVLSGLFNTDHVKQEFFSKIHLQESFARSKS